MSRSKSSLIAMASEWASELCKFKGHELLAAEEAAWGFEEVKKGRHPDVVLKEVLAKITERIPQSVNLADGNRPTGNLRPPLISRD